VRKKRSSYVLLGESQHLRPTFSGNEHGRPQKFF